MQRGYFMNKHAVFVAGKRFVLLSEDSTEYVQNLAQEVNDAILNIATVNPTLEGKSCAILCALDYADDMYKQQEKNKRFSDNAKAVIAQSDAHAKKIKELKETLISANNEVEKLKEEAKIKNKEIETLKEKLKEIQAKDKEIENLQQTVKKLESKDIEIARLQEKVNKLQAKTVEKKQVQPVKQHYRPAVEEKKENPMDNLPKPEDIVKEKGYKPLRQISLFDNE